MENTLIIPLDVPESKRELYRKNYLTMTHETDRLMLFAGDQKAEHLNSDYYGENISVDDATPEHLFKIASQAKIGVFATQLGLIARYGTTYGTIPYLIKMNSKTNVIPKGAQDPLSSSWYSMNDIAAFVESSKLQVCAVGYTIYMGSLFEEQMLREAAHIIYHAHRNGLVAVLWAYPRGTHVVDEYNGHLIAGAAGLASTLGADFVKVNAPKPKVGTSAEALREAVNAAGRTRLVCAGGSSTDVEVFLRELYDQLHVGGASGNATGRNIHQKDLKHAIAFSNSIYALTVENKTLEEALALYKNG
ncbi:MAG: aldolase [Candidatus Roizmanbacteria bacterium]|nr:aldolase [Candidatus Roizmanbacteria bacterium]